jgi:hypothetical protein
MHDHDFELLTAYVDGELTNRQRKAVTRLLSKSPEARKLLAELQGDARALRDLPRPSLDRDLSADVIARIRERRLQPIRRRQTAPATLPAWTGMAIAASLLLAIGSLSYIYFVYSEPEANVADLDRKSPVVKDGPLVVKKDDGVVPEKDKTPIPIDPVKSFVDPDNVPQVADTPPEKEPPVVADGPKSNDNAVASPGLPAFDPTKVQISFLPVVVNLHQLDQDKGAAPLHEVLNKSTGFRLEMPCPDSTKGLERLQKVLGAHGFMTIVDPVARERAKIKARTSYVAYAEDLTRDELFRILKQIGIEERNARDGQIRDLVITKLGKDDYKELSKWLSAEISQPLAKPGNSLSVDPRKPVADGTADQVLDKLNGKSPVKKQHLALIAAPNANPGSPEVKRFLGLRGPAKADSIQIMLVLRAQ